MENGVKILEADSIVKEGIKRCSEAEFWSQF